MNCTIVSLYPGRIDERKKVYPGVYKLEPGDPKLVEPSVLIIKSSVSYMDSGIDRPMRSVPHSPKELADSVVNDWIYALPEVSLGTCQPAVFVVEGEHTAADVKKKFMKEIERALELQKNWFIALIKRADMDWGHAPGMHRAITEDAKIACKYLEQDRPWLLTDNSIQITVQCPACFINIDPRATICYNCKTQVKAVKAS